MDIILKKLNFLNSFWPANIPLPIEENNSSTITEKSCCDYCGELLNKKQIKEKLERLNHKTERKEYNSDEEQSSDENTIR